MLLLRNCYLFKPDRASSHGLFSFSETVSIPQANANIINYFRPGKSSIDSNLMNIPEVIQTYETENAVR